MTRRKQVLLVILGVLAVACAVVVVPMILIGVGLGLEKAAQEDRRRHYVPKDLTDAVKFEYATAAMISAFLDHGETVDQTVDVGNGQRWPLIRAATTFTSVEVARLLIRRGAKIEQAGLWSCLRGGRERMARMLIEEGASRTVKTENGLRLREGACYGGYPEQSDRRKLAELLR